MIYAGLWEAFRSPWGMSSGGPGSGLFKSTDGGDTWTEITKNAGLPPGMWGKVGVSVSPVDGNRVYALVENEKGGLYVSDDAGASWKLINENRNLRQRAFYYTRVVADTKEKDTVYVLNVQFFKSTDGGKTTTTIRVPHGDNHDLWICAGRQPAHGAGERWRRERLGQWRRQSWTDQEFPTGQFYNVFTTRHVPYHVCGAQQDNSTACVGSQANPGAGRAACRPSSTRSAAARAATSRRIRTT